VSVREFAMPDLGEGLTESELVSWEVAEGDTVELNQVIAEVETAKALVQLPSPWAGTVSRLLVEPGAVVRVGSPIVAIEVADAAEPAPSGPPARNAVLVGYGPPVEGGARPQRRSRAALLERAQPDRPPVPGRAPEPPARQAERPMSTPPVRKLAADRGVRLELVHGSGEHGTITRDDVLRSAAEAATSAGPPRAPDNTGVSAEAGAPDEARPDETRVPVTGVRRRTAEAMVASAFTAPHVTVFHTIDVTPARDLATRLTAAGETKIGLLAIVSRAVCLGLAVHPELNSRWEDATQEIVQYGYVNLGIAAATDRGLVVPNIKGAGTLGLTGIAAALAELTAEARAGKATPERLSGGTFSITNIGVFGVETGTPILNPGEAGILALGAARRRPWEFEGGIALREVMTLSLSFDHRVVDGAQGSRFLAELGAMLERADPDELGEP